MFTLLIAVVSLSVLIFVHEFGHFIVAKKSGMKVEEFGFGFPPRIWGKKKGGTLYSLNWIPFGGFVRIFGEDGESRSEQGSYGSKPISRRMMVICAGVVMNLLFAAFLLMVSNTFGLRIELSDAASMARARDKKIQIVHTAPDSPASWADLRPLDEITGFRLTDGVEFVPTTVKSVQDFSNTHIGKNATILIRRSGEILEKDIQFRADPPPGQGPLGIGLTLTGVVSYPWYQAIGRGVYDAYLMTRNTATAYIALFSELFTKGKLIADVSGPIGIVKMTGQAADFGISFLIQFIAMISVNLAVLNVIPFPALDGGQALLLILEKIKGAPIKKRTVAIVNTAGFFVLIALLVLVTAKDIVRLL